MKRAMLFVMSIAMVAIVAYSITTAANRSPSNQTIGAHEPRDLSGLSVATFAGGCFWCVEAAFEVVPGVREVISGFSGGDLPNPTYEQVANGLTAHTEAVHIHYDPKIITYEGLLQVLWRTADPTDSKGQFSDRGQQYRPAIFYHDEDQRHTATRIREELAKSGRFEKPVTIEITKFVAFYPAEQNHQDYYLKNPWRYLLYTHGSGRADFQQAVWGDDLAVDFSRYRPRQNLSVGAESSDPMGM